MSEIKLNGSVARNITFQYAPKIQQACIGLADDSCKTIIREDGSLNYHYLFDWEKLLKAGSISGDYLSDNQGFQSRLKPELTFQDNLLERKQDFGDPKVAFVKTYEQYDSTTLEWECFAYHVPDEDLRIDVILWDCNLVNQPNFLSSPVELRYVGEQTKSPKVFSSKLINLKSKITSLHDAQQGYKGVFVVLQKGALDPDKVTRDWAENIREKSRDYWLNLKPFQNRFEIPDQQIQKILESCGRNILQAREIHNEVPVFQVGPTMYRGLWTVDGHFLLEAAHYMGRGKEAYEQGLFTLLSKIQPNGSIELIPKHTKETAIGITTIIRQCELYQDDERIKNLWPVILRAIDYLKELRSQAIELGPDYPGYNLFPPAFIDGGIEGPHPDLTTPAWILVGLKQALLVSKRLNLPSTEDISNFYNQVKEGFLSTSKKELRYTDQSIPFIPMALIPYKEYKPQTATWAFAQSIYPGEVFAPEDILVQNFLELLDSIDNDQGIPKETGWVHDDAVWGYSAMFYAQVWLYAGRPDKAIDYLYGFANHASPARVWREEQSLNSSPQSMWFGDMPHNWGSAEFIRLVRHLIILEKHDSLELLAGLPDQWIPDFDHDLLLEDNPTRYGKISLRLRRTAQDLVLLAYSRKPSSIHPKEIIVHWKGITKSLPNDLGVNQVYLEELNL